MPRIWRITAGHKQSLRQWRYLKSSKRVMIGFAYGRLFDPVRIRDEASFENALAKAKFNWISREQIRRFWGIEKNDLVIAKRPGRQTILGIGFVKSKRVFKDKNNPLGYEWAKQVDWIPDFEPINVSRDRRLSQSISYPARGHRVGTIHEITDKYSIGKIVKMVKRFDQTKAAVRRIKFIESPEVGGYRPQRERISGPTGRLLSMESIAESSSWGVKKAMLYEKSEGRRPENVSLRAGFGYDIFSKNAYDKIVRCIEVKARRGWRTEVALTDNEYETARKLRDEYYVYIITGEHEGRVIRNPSKACKPKKITVWVIDGWEGKGHRIRI